MVLLSKVQKYQLDIQEKGKSKNRRILVNRDKQKTTETQHLELKTNDPTKIEVDSGALQE